MKVTGIVAEYNPFHTGHAYHLKQAKELTGADYIVVIMSPDFVQRGEPAVFDKYTRTQMALKNGADLVLELPVCYATASAEYFAEGAVSMLDSLHVTNAICFGAESGSADEFLSAADFLLHEPEDFSCLFQEQLRSGKSFPLARSIALESYTQEQDSSALAKLISSPNSILGTEYCKAILNRHSTMKPVPVIRKGSGYHELSVNQAFSSATAIRRHLNDPESILNYIPDGIKTLFLDSCKNHVILEDFLSCLTYILLTMDRFDQFQDISSELSERLINLRFSLVGKSYSAIISKLKTRQLTEARIRRALLHTILSISAEDTDLYRKNGTVFYARILGMKKTAAPLMHAIKHNSEIPLIAKTANAERNLSPLATRMWQTDLFASHLYKGIQAAKSSSAFHSEFEHSPVLL